VGFGVGVGVGLTGVVQFGGVPIWPVGHVVGVVGGVVNETIAPLSDGLVVAPPEAALLPANDRLELPLPASALNVTVAINVSLETEPPSHPLVKCNELAVELKPSCVVNGDPL
jgi:hypothetical protein